MTALRRVLITGRPDDALLRALRDRLKSEGYAVASDLSGNIEAELWGIVVTSQPAGKSPIDDLDIGDFLDLFDAAMTGAADAVRTHLEAGTLRRIVLVGSLAARGRSRASVPAAIGGGLGALARSWALELVGERITANAILADDAGGPEVAEGAAEATAFLLSSRAATISGQVLRVSRDTEAGIQPL